MALADRLHHTMRIVRGTATGPVIEGHRDEGETFSGTIRCLLTTAPAPEQASASGRRTVTTPTLLCAPTDTAGNATALGAGDVVEISAPRIHHAEGLPDPSRYEVDGRPQPLARPGSPPMGFNATLSRVGD